MGPQNAIMGDDSYGTQIPKTESNPRDLAEMQKAAKFSRTAEFKALKEHLEGRIVYYQQYLPGGQDPRLVDPATLGPMWIAANVVVGEMRAIIEAYEMAAETMKDEASKRKTVN